MHDLDDAADLARSLLEAELPKRWAHSRAVAAQAADLRPLLDGGTQLVTVAAFLHDIGYASALSHSGFHPLDGARHLRDVGFGDRALWALVAHHTCAQIEAEQRGLADALVAEFPIGDADPFLLNALTYCDLTTGPDGRRVEVDERLAEIFNRYGQGDVVHDAISRAAPILRGQADEIATALQAL